MRLLTVGDSFTYGDELEDRGLAWPFLLGNKIGYTVNNLAKPGSGNTRMVRHAVEQINNYDLIIIAWSHFARIEFADEYGAYDIWPGNAGNLFQGDISYRKDILKYINKHHCDVYLYSQYLINIILLQNYLKQLNKKYIMLDSFDDKKRPDTNNPIEKMRSLVPQLESQIDSTYYLGWPNETMMEWTYGTPQGPRGHFLEQGHEQVADKIYEYIRHLGWIS
jgi:hypothetical protein